MPTYWIEFHTKRLLVELPDGLTEDEIDKFLDKAQRDADVEALVTDWDAGEHKPRQKF